MNNSYIKDAADFSEYLRSPKDYPLYQNRPLDPRVAARGKASAERLIRNLIKSGATLIPISE